jgi:hypothetical protein
MDPLPNRASARVGRHQKTQTSGRSVYPRLGFGPVRVLLPGNRGSIDRQDLFCIGTPVKAPRVL